MFESKSSYKTDIISFSKIHVTSLFCNMNKPWEEWEMTVRDKNRPTPAEETSTAAAKAASRKLFVLILSFLLQNFYSKLDFLVIKKKWTDNMVDYYSLLEVTKNASAADIKKAYVYFVIAILQFRVNRQVLKHW